MSLVYAGIMHVRHASRDWIAVELKPGSAYSARVVQNAAWVPRGAGAVTLGKYIYCRDACSPRVLRHELTHAEQYRRWGFFGFAWRYGQDLVLNGYENSYIEREARAAEKR
jgi:hypothetical protein